MLEKSGWITKLLMLGIDPEEEKGEILAKVRVNGALLFSVCIFLCLGAYAYHSFSSDSFPLFSYFFWGSGFLSLLLWLWNAFGVHAISRSLGYLLYLMVMVVYGISFGFSSEGGRDPFSYYFLLLSSSFYVFLTFPFRWAPIGVVPIILFGLYIGWLGKDWVLPIIAVGTGAITWLLVPLWDLVSTENPKQNEIEEEVLLKEVIHSMETDEQPVMHEETTPEATTLAPLPEKQQVPQESTPSPPEDATNTMSAEYAKLKAKLDQYESRLLQMEKLITLGKLIAGIIHEINTPIGAVNAANTNLNNLLPTLTKELPQIIEMLDKEQRESFFQLLAKALQERPQLSSREERNLKKTLQEELEAHGLDNARTLAGDLVKMGIYENIAHYMPLLKHEKRDQILDFLSNFGKLRTNISNIDIASEKIMKLVKAVRSYIHQKQEQKRIPTNLIQNIETVLTLYHNMLKYGITVIREYDETIPEIACYPDELSQVWTNLIHNAAQAMKGEGELRIRIEQDDQYISVSIQDNGPGIPDEIKDRIFEPFFTTKPEGEGTGLGLDIAKKIVEERHNGKIAFFSEPGKTIFTVKIPKNLT